MPAVPASAQERFERTAREAAAQIDSGARTLADAATLADELGDRWACAALHMLREAISRLSELIEEEVNGVDARLPLTRPNDG